MRIARRIRPVVCLLLAVATAIGTAPALRACACTAPASQPAGDPATARSRCAAQPGKGCCGSPEEPSPARSSGTACDCAACECGSPAAPATPAPKPVADSAAEPAAPAVALFLLPPVTAGPAARPAFAADRPPPDLVITLSRLTC